MEPKYYSMSWVSPGTLEPGTHFLVMQRQVRSRNFFSIFEFLSLICSKFYGPICPEPTFRGSDLEPETPRNPLWPNFPGTMGSWVPHMPTPDSRYIIMTHSVTVCLFSLLRNFIKKSTIT